MAQALEDSNQPSPLGLPQSQEERLHYILKLLLADSQPQSLKELSQDLYVSPQTLTMDLHQVGQLVGGYAELAQDVLALVFVDFHGMDAPNG